MEDNELFQEEGLFDDYEDTETTEEEVVDEDETEATEEEIEDTPIEDETDEEPVEDEPYMTIRYNHEDKPLTREEAVELAQKGMNYDNIHTKYNDLYNQVEDLAQMNGMNVSDYLNSLSQMHTEYAMAQELASLQEQYPDASEDLLKEIAEKRIADKLKERQEKATNKEKVNDQQMGEIKRQLDVFQRKYPNLDAQNLDPKVYELMGQGYTLLEAYNEWKETQVRVQTKSQNKKAAVKKANENNAKKGLGNIVNTGNVDVDDFLTGFNS